MHHIKDNVEKSEVEAEEINIEETQHLPLAVRSLRPLL